MASIDHDERRLTVRVAEPSGEFVSRDVLLDDGVFVLHPASRCTGYVGIVDGFGIGVAEDGSIADLDCYIGPEDGAVAARIPVCLPVQVVSLTLSRPLDVDGDVVDIPGGEAFIDKGAEIWWCVYGEPRKAARIGRNLYGLIGERQELVGVAVDLSRMRTIA